MTVKIRPIAGAFAGEAGGVDLSKPLAPADAAAIEAGMDQHAVLVFPGQLVTDEQQMAFTRNFGDLEGAAGGSLRKPGDYRLAAAMVDVSNLDTDNKILARDDRRRLFNLGNQLWHSDGSFRAIPPTYSLLSGRIVTTEGGNTEFADMRAAWDDLSAKDKALVEDLVTEHSQLYSRGALGFTEYSPEELAQFTPVRQKLVRRHPVTGVKSLYLSSHIGGIVGWPVPEARAFIRELAEHATQATYVYVHRWTAADLVIWDNRTTMHRVRRFDDKLPRDMRRTTVAGTQMTVTQERAA